MSNGIKENYIGRILPTANIKTITLEDGGYTHVKREPHISGIRPEYIAAGEKMIGGVLRRTPWAQAAYNLDQRLKEFQNPIADEIKNLKTTLHFTINEVVKSKGNKIITNWINNNEHTKWIKLALIQSPSATFTKNILQNPSLLLHMVQTELSPLWNIDFADEGAAAAAEEWFNVLNDQGHIKFVSFADSLASIDDLKQYNNFTDPDGNQIYEIPFKETFDLGTDKPDHLAYFIVTYIDIYEMATEMGFDPANITENLSAADISSMIYEIAIDDSSTSSTEKIFKTSTGAIWDGPVHQMSDGRWMTGASHEYKKTSGENGQQYLSVLTANNTKVQDFRHFELPEQNIIKDLFTIQEPLAEINKYASIYDEGKMKPKIKDSDNYIFSNFSRYPDNTCGIYFCINPFFLLKDKTIFPNFYSDISVNDSKAKNIFQQETALGSGNIEIKNLKLFRRRISKNMEYNKLGMQTKPEDYYEDEAPELVATWPSRIPQADARILELTNINVGGVGPASIIKHFTVADHKIKKFNEGLFEYSLELEIKDPVYDYFRTVLSDLYDARAQMKDYHRASLRRDENNIPYYDVYLNRFNQKFADLYMPLQAAAADGETVGPSGFVSLASSTNPFKQIIENYGNALLFLTPGTLNSLRQDLVNKIDTITHPASGNPVGIEKFINMIDSLIYNISNVIGISGHKTSNKLEAKNTNDDVTEKSKNTSKSKEINEFIVYKEKFKTHFDASSPKNFGFIYIDQREMVSSNEQIDLYNQLAVDGIKTISRDDFLNRAENETKRYFDSSWSDASFNISSGQQTFIQGDNTSNTKYSFLSPSSLMIPTGAGTEKYASLVNVGATTAPVNASYIAFGPLMEVLRRALIKVLEYNLNEKEFDNQDILTTSYNSNPKSNITDPEQNEKRMLINLISSFGITVDDNILNLFPETNNISVDSDTNLGGLAPTAEATTEIVQLQDNSQSLSTALGINKNPNLLLWQILRKIIFKKDFDISIFNVQNSPNVIADILHAPSSQYADSEARLKAIKDLPNQIKSLLLQNSNEIQGALNVKDRTFIPGKDPRKNLRQYGWFWLCYENIAEIEYISGFDFARSGIKPVWKRLTKEIIDNINLSTLLCRLKKYDDVMSGIVNHKSLEVPIYNEYFMITTDMGAITTTGPSVDAASETLSGNY